MIAESQFLESLSIIRESMDRVSAIVDQQTFCISKVDPRSIAELSVSTNACTLIVSRIYSGICDAETNTRFPPNKYKKMRELYEC